MKKIAYEGREVEPVHLARRHFVLERLRERRQLGVVLVRQRLNLSERSLSLLRAVRRRDAAACDGDQVHLRDADDEVVAAGGFAADASRVSTKPAQDVPGRSLTVLC